MVVADRGAVSAAQARKTLTKLRPSEWGNNFAKKLRKMPEKLERKQINGPIIHSSEDTV